MIRVRNAHITGPRPWETPADLSDHWEALKEEHPSLRTRRAAQRLSVSEAQLLASRIGDHITWLEGDWSALIERLEGLGRLMALTRNESAVHEVTGHYENTSISGPVGVVLGEDIDLRLFMMRWAYGFAVETPWKGGLRRSLQFFDERGDAVHKVYLKGGSDLDAYQTLVDKYAADNQQPLWLDEPDSSEPQTPTAPIDAGLPDDFNQEQFHRDWLQMEDTHDFFDMFRGHDLNRIQAIECGPEQMVTPVSPDSTVRLLEQARDRQVPIMIFVGNRGCIQIFTGEIRKLLRTGDWFNILDPGFNLHLKDGDIHSAYVVRKPTVDGLVTSLEIYDEDGESIALIFGERKPGIPEDRRWRNLVEGLVD